MKSDLTEIPFDHYQRYATAASIVHALGAHARTVLEVGANRQRLLGEFLPDHRLLYSDLEPQDEAEDFVVADACALPFAEQGYDVVVSLDVLEHIPPELRAPAIAEMARVASRAVVIGCPIDHPWVHEAEEAAHSIWRHFFNKAYPWLEEHEEYGLVDACMAEAALESAGLRVVRFGQGDARLWAALMGAHFVKEAVPELGGVVAAIDSYYNHRLFEGDRSETAYREFFVGVRKAGDLKAVRRATVLVSQGDAAGCALLSSLGQRLLPVADRVREAELQWGQTAESLVETETRLQEEALAHHRTGLKLREEEERAVEQLHRADSADQKNVELQGIITEASERLQQETLNRHRMEMALRDATASAVEQLKRADAADKKTIELEKRLQKEALAHHEAGLELQKAIASAVEQLSRADAADEKTVRLEERLQEEALAHHQTGLKLQEMAASAVEQLRRADAADQKTIELQKRLKEEALAHHQTGLKLQEMAASAVEQLRRADAADQKTIELQKRLKEEALAHHQTGLKLQEMAASAAEQLRRADAADQKTLDLQKRLKEEALAHHQTGLKLQEMAASAVEQLRRADAADQKTIDLQKRLQEEALAHHQTGLKLQEMSISAVEQLRRADAADEKYIALDAKMAQTRGQLKLVEEYRDELLARLEEAGSWRSAAEEQISLLNAERKSLENHVDALLLQIKGWERRQRWAIGAVLAAIAATAGYILWY